MTSRKKSARDKFSLAAVNAVSRSRRQRDRPSEVDQWRLINMPVGYLARRRRSMQLLSLPAEGDRQKEEQKPPKLSPFLRFRRVARVILHLCRFCLSIAKACRDMTPASIDELLYFAGKGAEESNRFGFNKDRYRRNFGDSMPPWAVDLLNKPPLDRNPRELRRLQGLLRTIDGYRCLSSGLQQETSQVVQYERYGPNRIVLKEGHIGNAFYIVYSGSLFVNRYEYDRITGQRHLATATLLQKGNCFGEIALIHDCRRTASVVTREPVELLSIDKRSFSRYPSGFQSDMMLKEKFAREVQLFSGWKEDELQELLFKSQVIDYQIGKVIDQNGSNSHYLYILMEGRCKVLRKVNIQKLRAKVEKEREEAAVNTWIKTHLLPPMCPKPVSAKHQAAQHRKQQSPSDGQQKRKSLPLNLTEEEDEKEVYIHVGNITAKTVFDLSWLDSKGPPPTLCLVSEGVQALRVPKSEFMNRATDEACETARNCIVNFCTDGELYDECSKYNKWRTFRQRAISDNISSQIERGVWRTQKAAEATLVSMLQTATKPIEFPRYFQSKDKHKQLQRKTSGLPFDSMSFMSQLTMSNFSTKF
ncbi:uncharacterized protein LOC134191842 [Corticium candelabrum]|uniref:uncharacterized protein LOC134191842 n=1 Tax=Corticium candelabrum TaxID=121492 RepID=UPI002E265C76|nr:uncharacterized protein LOC134191842 [Corticium candelabrum]